MEENIPSRYLHLCPNCGGPISSERLVLGAPCEKCLPVELSKIKAKANKLSRLDFMRFIVENLRVKGKYIELYELEKELSSVDDMARKILGNGLWSAQKAWVKRLIKGYSFSITAPTGLGKTFFGILSSIYLALKNKKSLIVVPTVALVVHVLDRLKEYTSKLGVDIKYYGFYTGMHKKDKARAEEALDKGDFSIIVLTSMGLVKRFEKLKKYKFDFIFVDDVDALLKSSRNIDRVLMLIGFREEHIQEALHFVRRLQSAAILSQQDRDELYRELQEFRNEIKTFREKNGVGQLIVSTATGTIRGLRVRILRELLDFSIGSGRGGIRNIVDSYHIVKNNGGEHVVELAEKLGTGGLIFLHRNNEKLRKKIISLLEKKGLRVGDAATPRANIAKLIQEFEEGKLDILIGVASYYGKLSRGLDLPHIVRYAIFVGVPSFRFRLEIKEDTHPVRSYILLKEIVDYIEDGQKRLYILKLLNRFSKKYFALSPAIKQQLIGALRGEGNVPPRMEALLGLIREINRIAMELLKNKEIINKLSQSPYIVLKRIKDMLYIEVPDVRTYIQCSGRTSRMFAGGVTKGLSVILTSNKKLLDALIRRSKWFIGDIEWKELSEIDLDELLREIDKDRETVRAIMAGKIPPQFKDLMKSALMIVESPTKAKTIARFYGRPARRRVGNIIFYEVATGDYLLTIVASRGHVYDLVLADPDISNRNDLERFFDTQKYLYGVEITKSGRSLRFIPEYDIINTCMSCGKKFTGIHDKCPRCGSTQIYTQYEIVEAIREIGNEVDLVIVATDPDTEGEKIGYDLFLTLKPIVPTIYRAEYHAVTTTEIKKALENLKNIDLNRVKAQLVRRILDRWVGFAYSHLLWMLKSMTERRGTYSAGRVQTPVLGWIIERYYEYRRNMVKVLVVTLENGYVFTIEAEKIPPKPSELIGKRVKIQPEDLGDVELPPPPPYITAEVLKDISSRLRISTGEAMRILQELFESGLITYHRTDSTRVSPEGIRVAREYIVNNIGSDAFQPRSWSKGEEGAHECIRPTRPIPAEGILKMLQTGELTLNIVFTRRHYRVYDLIFRRFMASQMKPARVRKIRYVFRLDSIDLHEVEGVSEVLVEGYTKVWPITIYSFPEELTINSVKKTRISKVPLYTESDIVERMRSEGIGRPSTYAVILETLFKRKYIGVSQRKRKIFPTKKGIDAYNTLMEALELYVSKLEKRERELSEELKKIVTVEGTRELEAIMDKIEIGKEDYQKVLANLYRALQIILHDLKKYYFTELLPKLFNNKASGSR